LLFAGDCLAIEHVVGDEEGFKWRVHYFMTLFVYALLYYFCLLFVH